MIGAILGMILDALKRIGNNTDAAGTNTLFAYLARGGVKNVQRGKTLVSNTTVDVTISAVNMAKSYLNFPNGVSSGGAQWTAELLNSTTIRFSVSNTGGYGFTWSWEVIEHY